MGKSCQKRARAFVRLLAPAALTVLIACASGQVKEFRLVPAGEASSGPEVEVRGVRIVGRYLDKDAMRGFFNQRGRGDLAAGLGSVELLAMQLTITNGSGGEVIFDPKSARLADGSWVYLSPLSNTDLYMMLPRSADRQSIMDGLARYMYVNPVTVAQGGEESRLLLFARPEKIRKGVSVSFGGIYLDRVPLDPVLLFEAVPTE